MWILLKCCIYCTSVPSLHRESPGTFFPLLAYKFVYNLILHVSDCVKCILHTSSHLPVTPSTADEACYWLKRIPCSGWLCVTSIPIILGRCGFIMNIVGGSKFVIIGVCKLRCISHVSCPNMADGGWWLYHHDNWHHANKSGGLACNHTHTQEVWHSHYEILTL